MALARLYCVFLLLLYSKWSCGQQAGQNNQNAGANNAIGPHQQAFQRASNNFNQAQNEPNAGFNANLMQANLQASNFQQSPSPANTKQGNLQQSMNLPPNLQSQGINNMQITKIGFSPISPTMGNPSTSTISFQNTDVVPNGQIIQSQLQNMPGSNSPVTQIANGPISTLTLGDLVGLKGQSLLSLMNGQNNDYLQQNQQSFFPNMISTQNQLTDMQKQFLVKSFQAGQPFDSAMNLQGINVMHSQPRVQVPSSQPAQAKVTPLGKQPAYITVQARPLDEYLKQQAVATATDDPAMPLILSEFNPQYAISAAYPSPKKGSKINLKSLIPLIISLLKEKKCECKNCNCLKNTCHSNNSLNSSIESEIAKIFGGYSNLKTYGAKAEDSEVTNKKKASENKPQIKDKHKNIKNKKIAPVDTEEISEEDSDSDYLDDD